MHAHVQTIASIVGLSGFNRNNINVLHWTDSGEKVSKFVTDIEQLKQILSQDFGIAALDGYWNPRRISESEVVLLALPRDYYEHVEGQSAFAAIADHFGRPDLEDAETIYVRLLWDFAGHCWDLEVADTAEICSDLYSRNEKFVTAYPELYHDGNSGIRGRLNAVAELYVNTLRSTWAPLVSDTIARNYAQERLAIGEVVLQAIVAIIVWMFLRPDPGVVVGVLAFVALVTVAHAQRKVAARTKAVDDLFDSIQADHSGAYMDLVRIGLGASAVWDSESGLVCTLERVESSSDLLESLDKSVGLYMDRHGLENFEDAVEELRRPNEVFGRCEELPSNFALRCQDWPHV